jgi:hypothetical protein
MRYFELWLRIDGGWHRVGATSARDNADALGKAITLVPPEHMDKPMKLVEVERANDGGSEQG